MMFDQLNLNSFEFFAATVILIVACAVVFMLLRLAAILRTLEDNQRALRVHGVILEKILSQPGAPRWILEMDLPPDLSVVEGGEMQN